MIIRAIALFVLVGACARETPRTASPARVDDAPRTSPQPDNGFRIVWKRMLEGEWYGYFVIDGARDEEQRIEVRSTPQGYDVDFERVPDNTTWRAGEQSGYRSSLVLSIEADVAAMTLAKIRAYDPGVNLEIELGDGRRFETKLPTIDMMPTLAHIFERAAEGPVRLAGEHPAANRDTLIALTDHASLNARLTVVGRGTRVSDIDLVVFARSTEAAGGLLPTQAQIYDRRTGALVGQTTIPYEEGAPETPRAKKLSKAERWGQSFLSP